MELDILGRWNMEEPMPTIPTFDFKISCLLHPPHFTQSHLCAATISPFSTHFHPAKQLPCFPERISQFQLVGLHLFYVLIIFY